LDGNYNPEEKNEYPGIPVIDHRTATEFDTSFFVAESLPDYRRRDNEVIPLTDAIERWKKTEATITEVRP
jgi:hypothetical protein